MDQFFNTLRDYAFPKIGRRLVSEIGQPEMLSCLSPIWTEKHETAKRVAQRLKVVLDVAKSKGRRKGEVLGARWEEFDFESGLWTAPEERMKAGVLHRVPLTPAMLDIIEPLTALQSAYVFEGQKRHKPLSNMAMLMLLRRMGGDGVTVHGFRSAFRVWTSEAAFAPREVAEMSLAHKVGCDVERT